MSLKKDKFKLSEKKIMNFAVKLAENNKYLTGTNPSVGCVIVKKNKILSFATTNNGGRPHAESIALSKNIYNKGTTLYSTLEPCSHQGKTPPCTNAIIKNKVKKVYYSIEDNDFRSFNKTKKILMSKNIIVKSGLQKKKVSKLYKEYNYIRSNKAPYITGKIASSSNLNILNNNTPITNEHSRSVSHLLRFQNHAILTSYKTINTDNPKLNCRLNGLEKFSPTVIVIDKNLKIKANSFVIKNSKKSKLIIFHCSKNISKIKLLKNRGVKLISQKVNNNSNLNLKKITQKIYNLGLHRLLVEAGKDLLTNLLKENLLNEFYFFQSDKIISNRYKINISSFIKMINKNFKNKEKINTYLGNDTLTHYY
jgi:diaminohydroxyphosphoribosylaminopyrimidine deaminase/5-amino-6-(5-phosphoribosylamino)uracil reductase